MDFDTFQPVDMNEVRPADLAPLHAALDQDMTARQREFVEAAYLGLLQSPAGNTLPREVLASAACAVMFQVAHTLGGHTFYMPKIDVLRRARIAREIRARFNGRNLAQLAREYGCSEMRIRQIAINKFKA